MLAELRQAVDCAIADGESIAKFRKRFNAILQKYEWYYDGDRKERARAIYAINLRTSYAAGRWRQMQDVKPDRPYWQYRCSPVGCSPADVESRHMRWDGIVLHADDLWWHTHFPPNGRECTCYIDTLNYHDLEPIGKDGPDKAPALDYRFMQAGERGQVRVPDGIDPGFAYAPGRSLML